jgi:hypothetical protein
MLFYLTIFIFFIINFLFNYLFINKINFFHYINYTMKINYDMLFLFGILVIGLLIASFFGFREGYSGDKSGVPTIDEITGGKNKNPQNQYDNYNHSSQTSDTMVSGTFDSQNPNGGTIVANSDGTLTLTTADGKTIVLTKKDTNTNINMNKEPFTTSPNTSGKFVTYYGADGITATVIYSDSGQQIIRVKDAGGMNTVYTQNGVPFNPNDSPTSGGQGQPYTSVPSSDYSTSYNYSGSLPTGIPASQIPEGQEDMYILKSEVVPPVCPACPSYSPTDTGQKQCQPCPSCARCPEPAFDCKKVPNYNSVNNSYLPVPALADFSTFGM